MISKVKLSVKCNFIFIQYLLNDFNDEFNRYINEWDMVGGGFLNLSCGEQDVVKGGCCILIL